VTVVIGIVGTIAGVFGMTFDTPLSHTGTNGFVFGNGGNVGIRDRHSDPRQIT